MVRRTHVDSCWTHGAQVPLCRLSVQTPLPLNVLTGNRVPEQLTQGIFLEGLLCAGTKSDTPLPTYNFLGGGGCNGAITPVMTH